MLDKCPICGFDCRGKRGGSLATLTNFPKHVVEAHPKELNRLVELEHKVMLLDKQARKETGLFLVDSSYWKGWKNSMRGMVKKVD